MPDRQEATHERLAALFHHRWAAPVLAELERAGGGAKLVTLAARTGASRESVRRALAALEEGGYVRPNPGYGHPMRPEYLLTRSGRRLAPACRRLVEHLARIELEGLGLRKWSMPVVHALEGGGRRFRGLQRQLSRITPRALTRALKDLLAAGLLERRVGTGHPPEVAYLLTAPARRMVSLLRELAAAI